MIDIKWLRENPETLKANCVRRGCDADIDAMVVLDKKIREIRTQVENMQAERNALSKRCKDDPSARDLVKEIKEKLTALEPELDQLDAQLFEQMSWLPNALDPAVPDGNTDEDNKLIRHVGELPKFDFQPRDHQDLGDLLGIIDTARGAKVAGTGFYYWVGKGAILAQATFFWVQKVLAERGFTPFMTPCTAREKTLFGTGYFPFFKDQSFKIEGLDIALIGTSEQTLVGYHADEILDGDKLPLKYTSFTPCFRTEAGSYGKASRGIFRVHQFHKVEQIIFCTPEMSEQHHLECLANEEFILQQLGIPYRVVDVCVGDMGAPGYRKYDIEGWFAGFNAYRELTSNTNLTDFQARRLNIRFKNKISKGFVHTISATAVTDRCIIAILENFQREDGSVVIPEVLRPFTGFDVIEAPQK